MSLKMGVRNVFFPTQRTVLLTSIFFGLVLNVKNFSCRCSRTTCVFFHPCLNVRKLTIP